MPAINDEFNKFAVTFNTGKCQLVHRVLVADTQTPVSAYLKLAGDKPNCFLLESVEGGEVRLRLEVKGTVFQFQAKRIRKVFGALR